ncbi:signal peptidase I [Bowmanella sp. JS7-9]|uniref:Signal peptidase I n=1 Tax=Pseudobowmanella zhangzhouensis TaxID=1537679 RepID=A0ABW1XH70_9ALTE|nr:signal peptidase I [Bowmanella sp. JS7-9]TBX25674.1 hypothetical protein TK45_02960 [Bowmanella sp. JS7-9]
MPAKLMKLIREYLPTALLVIGLFACRSSIADWYEVPTGSMQPTIVEGDRIFVDKLAYDVKVPFTNLIVARLDDPKAGDIVVFEHPQTGTRLIKRLIAGPGDVVSMLNNRLTINGQPLTYSQTDGHIYEDLAGKHALQWINNGNPNTAFGPVRLGEDEFLMLGDNRNNSADSRYFGLVRRDLIQGKAKNVLFSKVPDELALRNERAFKKLI